MRTPAQIIGRDAHTQLIFEGYVVLPIRTVAELRDCVEAAIAEPRRSPKLISNRVGDLVPMQGWILKGQVLKAIRLLKEIAA